MPRWRGTQIHIQPTKKESALLKYHFSIALREVAIDSETEPSYLEGHGKSWRVVGGRGGSWGVVEGRQEWTRSSPSDGAIELEMEPAYPSHTIHHTPGLGLG